MSLVAVPRPERPTLSLHGAVVESHRSSGSFVTNSWARAGDVRVKMSTSVSDISIGAADLMLTTAANGEVGQLAGGGATGFRYCSFNVFAVGSMSVSVN